LISQSLGNSAFFSKLCDAFTLSRTSKEASKIEDALWEALETGIKSYATTKTKLVMLIDGLDKIRGGDAAASNVHRRIHKLVVDTAHVRAIVTSQKHVRGVAKHVQHLALNKDHTLKDIRRILYDSFERHPHFSKLSTENQEKTIDHLCHSAEGDFLGINLVTQILSSEHTSKGFEAALKHLPTKVDALLLKLLHDVDQNSHNVDTKLIIAFMLAARRPLTLSEISILLHLDVERSLLIDGHIDVASKIRSTIGNFVLVKDQIVRFKHDAIRHFLIEHSGKSKIVMAVKEAQTELLIRLLLYTKLQLKAYNEPSIEIIVQTFAHDFFERHQLLEYSARYWFSHLKLSSYYGENGAIDLTSQLKALFPSSPLFAMFEWICWTSKPCLLELTEKHKLAWSLRQRIFGEQHVAVLQCLVTLSSLYESMNIQSETTTFTYKAYLVASKILTKSSTFVLHFASSFLRLTSELEVSSRTEIVIRREIVLKFVIEYHKSKYGRNSVQVLEYLKLLAALYVQIQEDDAAAVIYAEIHEITIHIYGKQSEEAVYYKDRMITLRKGRKEIITEHGGGSIFEICEEITVITDFRELIIQIGIAESLEVQDSIYLAEELFLQIWTRIIELCHAEYSIAIHMVKIDIALAYARFLRRHKRHAEASSIVLCIWMECEHETFTSEEIIIKIKAIGELMKSLGLLAVAVSVFKKVWSFFQSIKRESTKVAISVTEILNETVEQMITEEISETTTVMEQLFRQTISRSHKTESYTSIAKSCSSLVNVYMQEERLEEAITTIQTCLEIIWRVGITGIGMISLPEVCVSEVIAISLKLALCYRRQKFFEKAEEIYVRIYQACLFSLHIEDEHIQTTLLALIEFYEEFHCHDKTIDIYLDLIAVYRRQLGILHLCTLRTILAAAALCRKYGRKQCYELYAEIIIVLREEKHVSHKEVFEAATILVQWYHQVQRWNDLRSLCELLWIGCRSRKYTFEASILQLIYEKYVFVLDIHFKTEIKVLRQIAIEFRETAVKVFGKYSSIHCEALCAFASICERHEEYYEEALSTYEEVVSKSTTQRTIKERLTKLYVKVISSSTSTTVTQTERAVSLSIEHYELSKSKYGCWHQVTITALRELITLHIKVKTKQSHSIVGKLLQSTFVELLTIYKEASQELYTAAITLAELFVTAELVEVGMEIIHDLRNQIAFCGYGKAEKSKHKFDFGSVASSRAIYIFFVVFSKRLRGEVHVGCSDLLAELMTESILFEHFTRLIQTATVEASLVVAHAARLRHFLVSRHRTVELRIVEERAYEVFIRTYGASIKTETSSTFILFVGILEEMTRLSGGFVALKEADLMHYALLSAIEKIKHSLEHGQFLAAYEIAQGAYELSSARKALHDHRNIALTLKLCQYLAGNLVSCCPDPKILANLLGVSRRLVDLVFAAFREAGVKLVSLSEEDLDCLISLLGQQKNWADLESSLSQLWSSRDVQKKWSAAVVLNVGQCLVEARFQNKDESKAVRLCEDICYNLRRAHGALWPRTREMYDLLSRLYTAQGRFADAMAVHEDILGVIVDGEDFDEDGVDDGDEGKFGAMTPETRRALAQSLLELLKRAYMRLQGWEKAKSVYVELDKKLRREIKGIEGETVDKWDWKKMGQVDELGMYKGPEQWCILDLSKEKKHKKDQGRRQVKRMTSNWGMSFGDLFKKGLNGLTNGDHPQTNGDHPVIFGRNVDGTCTNGEMPEKKNVVMHGMGVDGVCV
jgi:tetratricopeptide (TPR) repeat protein